ncbi:MAG: signal peptidase II [Deltaproteobacteria bacterium]|nr:signal peptidase II [Deltaproteobacteria bacterium]
MPTKYKYLFTIAPLIIIADQVTKWLVVQRLSLGEAIPIIPVFFDLVHFRNTGAAFGMLAGSHEGFRVPFFFIMAAIAFLFLISYFRSLRADDHLQSLTLALLFGGIIGNVIDRIRLGSVVDFLCFHLGDRVFDMTMGGYHISFPLEWPAFNVADSAISVAMVLLIISSFRRKTT